MTTHNFAEGWSLWYTADGEIRPAGDGLYPARESALVRARAVISACRPVYVQRIVFDPAQAEEVARA